ncbi:hypothetical protein J2R96_002005 [Bradyrhizobium elkanii]|nr:hypothetical protein [Bradyrhizobium elkanii]
MSKDLDGTNPRELVSGMTVICGIACAEAK